MALHYLKVGILTTWQCVWHIWYVCELLFIRQMKSITHCSFLIMFKSTQVLALRLAVHAGNLCWCVETPRAGNPQKAHKEVVGVQRNGFNVQDDGYQSEVGEKARRAVSRSRGKWQRSDGPRQAWRRLHCCCSGNGKCLFSLLTTHFFCHLPRPHSLRYLRVSLQSSSLPFSDESWPSMKMWVIQFNFCFCRDRFDASGFSSSRDVGGPTLCCWLEVFRNILLSKFSMFLLLLDG